MAQQYKLLPPSKRSKYRAIVVRYKGPRKGKPYVRNFGSEGELKAFIQRNKAGGNKEEIVEINKAFGIKGRTIKDASSNSLVKDLKNWAVEGMGLGDMSADEEQYLRDFKEYYGRSPKVWEDPYLTDRTLQFVDKAFTAMTVASGPGLALKGVKAAMKGSQLLTKEAARATTKAAFKKAIKKATRELALKKGVKKRIKQTAKGAAKTTGKAFMVDYQKEVATTYGRMAVKAYKNVTR